MRPRELEFHAPTYVLCLNLDVVCELTSNNMSCKLVQEQADDTSASQDSDGKSVDGPNSGAKIQSKLDRDPAAPLLFAMGEDVFVIDARDNKWKEGQVVGLKRGGKYDVCLLDGHEESNIDHANISKFAPTASEVDDISHRSEPKEAGIRSYFLSLLCSE